MLYAFRTIDVPVQMNDGSIKDIRVPFDVELLHKVEETLNCTTGRKWFIFERSEKSIIEAFEEFCRPYFPDDFPWSKVHPTFAAFFLRHVKNELLSSINAFESSMKHTETPIEATQESSQMPDGPSQHSTAS